MKCSNCNNDAMYEYKLTMNKSLFYCGNDLPAFLGPRKKAGLLTLTSKNEENLASALDALTTSTAEPQSPKEDTTPKRTTKKKAN